MGVTLRDARDLNNPGAPIRDSHFIATTNIESWQSGPASAGPPVDCQCHVSTNSDICELTDGFMLGSFTAFKTDTDISSKPAGRRERELQAWQPEPTPASGAGNGDSSGAGANGRGSLDDLTFGPGASGPGKDWDQFAVNEALFGVKVEYNEDAYTTHLDRNAPDFKEKERKAAQLASEIMRVSGFADSLACFWAVCGCRARALVRSEGCCASSHV